MRGFGLLASSTSFGAGCWIMGSMLWGVCLRVASLLLVGCLRFVMLIVLCILVL